MSDEALRAAERAALGTLLSCYLREGGRAELAPAGSDGARVARLPLTQPGGELVADVSYLSPTGRHRFAGPARLSLAGGEPRPVGPGTAAALLLEALGAQDPRGPGVPSLLLERILASLHAVAGFLAARRDEVERLWGAGPLPFAETEQALLLGHMLHPTPKDRGEMSADQARAYAPERGARFPLRWLAVSPDLVEHDSAVGTPAPELAEGLLRRDADPEALEAALAGLGPRLLLPAHPFEADHLAARPEVAALMAEGAIVDLGPLGASVAPTSSLRTVYREDWAWQLKFSLHVRVTNSMRVTLPKELRRAVEAARLHRGAVGAVAARLAPGLVILQDPAYLEVRHRGRPIEGFSVLLRQNRWPAGAAADVSSLTALCQDHPFGGRSRLARIVGWLAADAGRPEPEVARDWFARYCEVLLVSLLRLYLDLGLCFEPHQQNTLLELRGGWPERAVVRDSQGYFHRELAHADLCAAIPGLGEESESIFPEELAAERIAYYGFVNNALGVVNALGIAGCADEGTLLGDLRRLLERERARGGRYPATLLERLLERPEWPCKANLRTRLHDMDELVGDISTQSVYVSIPNPLAAAG